MGNFYLYGNLISIVNVKDEVMSSFSFKSIYIKLRMQNRHINLQSFNLNDLNPKEKRTKVVEEVFLIVMALNPQIKQVLLKLAQNKLLYKTFS